MKKVKHPHIILTLTLLLLTLGLSACAHNQGQTTSSSKSATSTKTKSSTNSHAKTLLVYYSLTGNTKSLANKAGHVGNIDVVRIGTAKAYPSDDNDAVNQRVTREQKAHRYDKLTNVPNLSKYDTVIVGYPIWSNDVAYPIQSFLAQNQNALANKRIVGLSTSAMAAANAIKQADATVKHLAPKATIGKSLNLTSGDLSTSKIKRWLSAETGQQSTNQTKSQTAVSLTVGHKKLSGYLNDSVAGRQLSGKLPLTLSFDTFAKGYPEKYAKLSAALDSKGMTGATPKSGDIAYNENNQSLFIYYGEVGHFDELHTIGHISSAKLKTILAKQSGKFNVTIAKEQG